MDPSDDLDGNRNHDHRWDVRLSQGLSAEGWFYEMTSGGDRFEVKHDQVFVETGNLYVEYQDDPGRRGQYRSSGIATTEADCWIFVVGNPPHAFIGIPTDRLLDLARAAWRAGRRGEQRGGTCPTRGALVAIADALGHGGQYRRR